MHVFRNILAKLTSDGHTFLIIARDKDSTIDLLKQYNFAFIDRGKGGKSIGKKILYALKATFLLTRHCYRFHPDFLISFSSPYLSLASFITGIPHIAFDDTDNDIFTWCVYSPFAHHIITPASFPLKSLHKQVRFSGYFELTYLHPNRFMPDQTILNRLSLSPDESYVIVRFVSHSVLHDLFQKRIQGYDKFRIIKELQKLGRVFISSELPLDKELEPYRFPLAPSEMHHAIAFASLVLGESATMASEAAVLGIPAVFFDSVGRCYTREEEEKYGLVFRFDPTPEGLENGLKKAIEFLTTHGIKETWKAKRKMLLADSIDVTAFLMWFIENYPESALIMQEDPDYQNRFK